MDTPIEKMRLVWTRTFSIALHLLFLTGLNCCCESFFVFCICGNDRTAVFYALLFSVICFGEETDADPRSRRKPPPRSPFPALGLAAYVPDLADLQASMGNTKFAGGKIYICRLSGKNFAIGQRDTCRRQTFHLPSANKKFAIGKCLAGHRQNSCLING